MEENSITKLFESTVDDVRRAMIDTSKKQLKHHSPVDISLEFRSINVKNRSLLVARKKKQTEISITLVTRVTPEDAQKTIPSS